jgi:hypothetical protein
MTKIYADYADEQGSYDDKLMFELIECSIERVIHLMEKREPMLVGLELAAFDPYHIADWLKASIINNEPWLKNVDDKGRPKKLMKCGILEGLYHEADKAMMKAIQREGTVDLTEGNEELLMELDDGYRLVALLTPAALDREGYKMKHCIGQGAYDENVKKQDCLFLSLRDRFNNPQATMELVGKNLVQLQGKQNKTPNFKYARLLQPFIVKYGIEDHRNIFNLSYKFSADGSTYDISSMPDGTTLHGYVFINGDTPITTLPDNLTVQGDLHLKNSDIKELPSGLHVWGELFIIGGEISVLPSDLKVGKQLFIRSEHITAVDDDIDVGGSININDRLQRRGTLDKPTPYVGL